MKFNLIGSRGQTPLPCDRSGHEAVVGLLLDRQGVCVNLEDRSGRALLSSVAQNGREAAGLILGRQGMEASPGDRSFRMLLPHAAGKCHQAVFGCLGPRGRVTQLLVSGGWR